MTIAVQIFIFFSPMVISKWCLHAATVGRWWRDFKLPQEIFDLAATTILCSAMAHWEISTHFFSLSYWKPRNDEIYCFKRWFLLFQVMKFSAFILIFTIKSDTDFFLSSDYNLCLMVKNTVTEKWAEKLWFSKPFSLQKLAS